MGNLSALPNIGKVIEKELTDIGILTPEQLAEAGSKAVFLRLRARDESACLHKLYALQGAIEGIPDTRLSKESKKELKQFFKQVKQHGDSK